MVLRGWRAEGLVVRTTPGGFAGTDESGCGATGGLGLGRRFGWLGGDAGEALDRPCIVDGEQRGGAGLVNLAEGVGGGPEGFRADGGAQVGGIGVVAAGDFCGVEVGIEEVAD
jgi:hypothetical protein